MEIIKSISTFILALALSVLAVVMGSQVFMDSWLLSDAPFTDLYHAGKQTYEKEMESVKSNMVYLSRVDGSKEQDLLELAELRKCVALAKLGHDLSTAQRVQSLMDGSGSEFESYEGYSKRELSRALELRDALTERGVNIPEEDLLFLAYQECLLRK
jgi:hypothetical protein